MLASTEARARRMAADMTQSFRRSEQRFRNAMQYSAIGKALLDSNGAIVENNPAFARIFGRSDEALAGQSLNEFLDDGDTQPLVTSQMQAFDERGGVIRLTRSLRRGDDEVRHVQLTFAPVPNEPGIDVSRLVQVEDVTERVRAEAAVQALNRTLEARVAARTRELSEANRELESFAYSVSHDLRAPLRGIEGFSRMLGERHADGLDATGRDYLDRVRKGTARMGELIDALLKLARIGRAEPDVADVDLSALAADVGGRARRRRTRAAGRYPHPARACTRRAIARSCITCSRTCWAMPGNSPVAATTRASSSASRPVPMGATGSWCATTVPASTPTTRTSCSSRSSACTARTSSLATGSAWPR